MLLAIKVGNSKICIAKFNNPLEDDFSIIYDVEKEKLDWKPLNKLIFKYKGIDCLICSVVPEITKKFVDNYKSFFKNLLIINDKLNTGLNIKVKNQEKFGVDRLTCAVAAYGKYKENLAILDAGTATTITVLTKKGEILGGSIMPGIQMMRHCLHEKTASLPLIEINFIDSALGRDTESAIKSGIILGTAYAIKGIINEIEESTQLKLTPILTGGNSTFLSKYLTFFHYLEPHLVIEGMRLIYLKNIKN